MTRTVSSEVAQHPHLGHLFYVGVLLSLAARRGPEAAEAKQELDNLRNTRLTEPLKKEPLMGKKTRAHATPDPKMFTGQGIVFAIIDDREGLSAASDRRGRITTIDVIADAIEAALDAGHETSEDIARYLTTSAFQHEPDKRVRFNSILKAGDAVGADILRKLYNTYNELVEMAEDEQDPAEKKLMLREANGFAEALQVVLSPFTVEDPKDSRLVNWNEVDRLTELFEKEQRLVRKERKGKPQ